MRHGIISISLILSALLSAPVLAQSPYGEKSEFSSEWRGKQDNVVGYLSMPKDAPGTVPAIVLMHGSGGLGEREVRYITEFNKMGIATFAVDSFGPRGVMTTIDDQSKVGTSAMVSDALAALKVVGANAKIDRKRIAILGSSKGGSVALETAMLQALRVRKVPEDSRFAAHIALYPGCGVQYRVLATTGQPILVLLGGRDDYVGGPNCPQYLESIKNSGGKAELLIYPNGRHDFDGKDNQGYVELKHAQNFSKCLVYVESDGRFVYAKTNEVLDSPKKFFDVQAKDCMTKGASIGTDPASKKKSLEDIQAFLRSNLLAQ